MTTRTKKPSSRRLHHHILHTVVPHADNGYHPHLIRWQGMLVTLLFVIGLQFVNGLPVAGSAVLGSTTNVTTARLLEVTNEQRKNQDVEPLQLDERLNKAATLKAQDMLARQYWSHVSPSGTTPWDWFKVSKYNYAYAGENLGKGFRSASGVVKAWMDSKEHRDNLLSKHYEDVGFAVVEGRLNGEETNIIVALYGTEKGGQLLQGTGVLAATSGDLHLLSRLGVGLQSLSPAVLGSLVLLLLAASVALAAYAYRGKLPKSLRKNWYRHHGLYKAIILLGLATLVVALYGSGQI